MCMKTVSSAFVGAALAVGVLVGASGCSKDDGSGMPARVVSNPNTERADGPPANAVLDDCESGEECTGAASCMAGCGLHELGDTACTCSANELSCTPCALNAEFRPTVQPAATAFCPPGTDDDDPCTTKGEVCIDISYNNAGVGRREGCLCWQGRTRLEWDCTQNLNGFFQDMAPPTPLAPDAGTPPAIDGGTPPPPAVDAPVATD
jgi:hypothetical protein